MFLEINGQMFGPEEIKAYIEELNSLNEYLDAKVRYLSEHTLPNASGAHLYVYVRKDPIFPDKKVLSISYVYEGGPKHGIVLSGLKDVTVKRMDNVEETEE
jgi:hypothetical protein